MTSYSYDLERSQGKAIIDLISNRKFNFVALDRYLHTTELIECCREALAQFANVDELDCKTHAEAMGIAMELLKARYSVNAPPGWYPVMKQLRGAAASPISPLSPSGRGEDSFRYEATYDFSYEPKDILSHSFSPLHFFEEELKPFEEVIVKAANIHGTPGRFADGAIFLDAVMADMEGGTPEVLMTVRNKMYKASL